MPITKVSPPFAVSAGATSVSGSGTLVFSNSNGVTFGLNGSTVTASHNAITSQSVQTQNLVSVLGSTGNISFANGNGVTFGGNGSTVTASVQTNYQSTGNYLTTAALSQDSSRYAGTGFTSTTTAGTAVVGTHNTAGLSLGVPAFLTTAALSQDSSKYGGTGFTSTTTAGTAIVGTNNTSGLSLGVPTFLTTAALSQDSSKYAGTGFTSTTTAGTAIVGTHNTAGLSLGVPAYLTAAGGANFSAGVSTGGNTSGNTGVTGTRVVFAGGNNITVSQGTDANGATITISGANAGGAQTGISGIVVSDTTYSSGTVSFSNQANVTIGSSVNGATQYIRLSVAPVTNSSWTVSDAVTSATVGRLAFTNSNGLTLSLSTSNNGNHTVVGSYTVPTLTNSSLTMQAGASTLSSVSRIAFVDSNGVSFGASTSNNGSITITATVQTNYLTTADLSANSSKYIQNWKLTGNTSGTTSSAQGTDIWFSGGNSITVSGNSNTIVFSVGAYITTADLSANSSKYIQNWKLTGNTAGTTSSAQGTDVWFSGGNSITVSGNSNTIVFSVGNYITTADLSANSSNYVRNWKLTGNTAGTTSSAQGTDLWFAGGNGLTISGSSNTLSFSVANQTNQSGNVYVTSNTFGTSSGTYDARTLSIQGSGAISVAASNSGWVISAPVQTVQSEGIYVVGNTTANSSSSTYDARTLSISAAGNLSIGWNSAASQLVISGGTAAVGSLSFYASSNTTSSTSGTGAGTISMAGAGAISIAATNSGFIVSSPVTSSLSGTGWVQISTNGSTISIGATTTMNLYASSNTFGTSSGTADMRSISIAGAGAVSVAASNSGWVISGATMATMPFYENLEWDAALSATSTFGLSTGFFCPVNVVNTVQFNQVNMVVSASVPTTSCGNTISLSFGTSAQSLQVDHFYSFTASNLMDFYLLSRGASGSSTDIVTMSSTRNSVVTFLNETFRANATAGNASQTVSVSNSVSLGVSFPALTSATSTSVNAATTVTLWGTGYSSWASTASGSTTSSKTTGATMSVSVGSTYPGTTAWASNKLLQFNWAPGVVNPGLYWVGMVRGSSTSSSSSSASTSGAAGRSYTTSINFSDLTMTAQLSYGGMTNSLASSLGTFGGGVINSLGYEPGHGTYSATYAGSKTFMNNAGQANGEIALSDIATGVSFFKPWLQFASNRI